MGNAVLIAQKTRVWLREVCLILSEEDIYDKH